MKRFIITLILDVDDTTEPDTLKTDILGALNTELPHIVIACEQEQV